MKAVRHDFQDLYYHHMCNFQHKNVSHKIYMFS